jgi:hypothetical protein
MGHRQRVTLDFRHTSRRLRNTRNWPRRLNTFAPSTAHHARSRRLLCMGLFSQFLF